MGLFDWLDDYFSSNEREKIKGLEEELKLEKQLRENELKAHELEVKELIDKIVELTEALENPQDFECEEEKYWNNKYPKQNIFYSRRESDGEYAVDVRNYFQPIDDKVPTVSGNTNDEKALNALKWVRKKVKYVSDKNSYGFEEYWAYAYQTLKRKVGDCEDGAILLANIMLKSGIPYWRIRLNAGSVNGGGHAYVTYCRETDNEFVILDWCYWPNDLPIKDRKLHSEEKNYSDEAKNYYVWFSWNQRHCFGKMQTMKGMPKDFKAFR